MTFGILPQPVGLLKLTLNLVCRNNIQRRDLYIGDFIKETFNTGLHSGTHNLFQTWLDDRHH